MNICIEGASLQYTQKRIRKNAFAYTSYDIYTHIPKIWDDSISLLMVS